MKLESFPFLRALYLTILWTKQHLEYQKLCEEQGITFFKTISNCFVCGQPKETKKVSLIGPYCEIGRFRDTWNYYKSIRKNY